MKKALKPLAIIALLTVTLLSSFKAGVEEPKSLNLKMSIDEFNYVMGLLSKRPIDEGLNLYTKFAQQAQEQLKIQPEGNAAKDTVAKKQEEKPPVKKN
jgi:hypothetical protein